jgi:hypothetical protein
MDTLTGSTICSPQHDSAYWDWVGLLTDEGIVQLLIRADEVDANSGLPPTARIEVKGDWLRVCEEGKPWYFVVNHLEVVEWPSCDARRPS